MMLYHWHMLGNRASLADGTLQWLLTVETKIEPHECFSFKVSVRFLAEPLTEQLVWENQPHPERVPVAGVDGKNYTLSLPFATEAVMEPASRPGSFSSSRDNPLRLSMVEASFWRVPVRRCLLTSASENAREVRSCCLWMATLVRPR